MFKSKPLLSRFLLFVVMPVSAGLIASFLNLRGSLPAADGRVIESDVSQRVELRLAPEALCFRQLRS
jgi:hypothetical protein